MNVKNEREKEWLKCLDSLSLVHSVVVKSADKIEMASSAMSVMIMEAVRFYDSGSMKLSLCL